MLLKIRSNTCLHVYSMYNNKHKTHMINMLELCSLPLTCFDHLVYQECMLSKQPVFPENGKR